MTWLLVVLIGTFAGTLAGVIGFGGTTILMPILVIVFGPKAAVPIMAIASILGNISRVAMWWSVIRWRAVLAFSVTAIPGAAVGARILIALDPLIIDIVLGLFFIAMVPLRHLFAARGMRISTVGLSVVGAGIGVLTGIVANTGPINTPFFLAHGLTKGAFVGTEAMSSLAMFLSKSVTFREFGALPNEIILNGLIVGMSLMAGTWIAKRFLMRMNENRFHRLMDVLLIVAGLAMLLGAIKEI